MPLVLHLHSRSGEPELRNLLADRGETVIAARDEASLNERLLHLTAGGTIWDVRGVTFAGLLAMLRERADVGDPPALDVIAFRSRLAAALGGDPGAGRVPPLERAVRELRAHRVTGQALRALQREAPSTALEELVPAFAMTSDLPVPDDAIWALAAAAETIRLGRIMIVGFDDFASAQWAVVRALGRANDVDVLLAYEEGSPPAAMSSTASRSVRCSTRSVMARHRPTSPSSRPGWPTSCGRSPPCSPRAASRSPTRRACRGRRRRSPARFCASGCSPATTRVRARSTTWSGGCDRPTAAPRRTRSTASRPSPGAARGASPSTGARRCAAGTARRSHLPGRCAGSAWDRCAGRRRTSSGSDTSDSPGRPARASCRTAPTCSTSPRSARSAA